MASEKVTEAQAALREALEYDGTGMMKLANLTFDQAVLYSIARSLVQLCNHADEYMQRHRM